MPQSTHSDFGDTASVSSDVISLSMTASMARNSLLLRLRKAQSISDQLCDVHHGRSRTLWIRFHGHYVVKLGLTNRDQGSFWICSEKQCDGVYSADSTGGATKHLNKKH
ncbi:hypothetical protein B0T25DRAFT_529369 [Lasiosphaeria hispida]|uniref:Uncharacterized protein n=1 Tax=Lasiosphaeria hispida TaxID=260671 RepID=A0AAJ0MKT0_9PEZI|nr:hypothetical protein B0T25DRAFT_529369 [Lasiosphaeria hispida]